MEGVRHQNQTGHALDATTSTASPEQWEIIIEGMSKKKETRGDLVGKNKQSPIDPGNDDFGSICVCAVRYSLGRRTYMPHLVMGFIRPLLPDMPRRALWCMEQDVAEAVRNGVCGDEKIDKPAWVGFLAAVRDEMMRRINNGT